jgi:flavin-dependent dehydrogenase
VLKLPAKARGNNSADSQGNDVADRTNTSELSGSCDALLVGGGPAGSTAARLLCRAGWDVIVAHRARFPRDKLCAGWLTPDVFPLLDLTPDEYRATGLTVQEITAFRTSVMGGRPVETRYPRVVSYAIRRCEFDTFLLQRSGTRTLEDSSSAPFDTTTIGGS